MQQVKFFHTALSGHIDDEINHWIQENPGIVIKSIELSTSDDSHRGQQVAALVLYDTQ